MRRARSFRRFFRNFHYKVFALLLATLFWYIVQGEEILEINRRVLVRIETSKGFTVQGKTTRVKDATIHGPRVLLGNFPAEPLQATISIPEGKEGEFRYRVDKRFFPRWDHRLELTVHDPYETVVVDEEMTKTVAVEEFLKGVPADGYIIEKTVIEPSKVEVTGLERYVTRLDKIRTAPIDVSGLSQSKTFEVRLAPNLVSPSGLSRNRVKVSLQLGEKKVNKRIGTIPVDVVGSEYLAKVKPKYVTAVIQATPGVLSFVRRGDLEAFVDATDLSLGKKYTREIKIKIPPDTVLVETFPEKATVELYNQKRLD